jgi:stage II sporulation protein AA (anti-sigma F factor antagonist)
MSANHASPDFFTLHDQGGNVTVAELLLPESLDALEFDRLNESLLSAIDANPSGSWVLDLAGTAYMGSAVLGLLVNLRQRVKSKSGQIALCCLSPALLGVFHACSLQRLFTLCKSRQDALNHLRRN